MSVQVGSTLNYKGRSYLVTSIEKRQAQTVAPEASLDMEAALRAPQNVKYLKMSFDTFEAGEIVNIFAEWCCLEAQGDTQFIYTKYEIRKETQSGSNGQSEDAHKAADSSPQAADGRPAGRPSAGGEGAGEDCGTLHGDGPA